MSSPPDAVPVLEIGGTHLTAALVRVGTWEVAPSSVTRIEIDADGAAQDLLDDIARGARTLGDGHRADWAVAIPGPFDYAGGVGLFADVGKFDNLNGVDVREGLSRRLQIPPASMHFLNDADAWGVGEYAVGAARGHDRAACITLGTGVGSAFLDRGEPVDTGPTVPPDGSVHLLSYRGRPLEDTVSRRAIRAAYAWATGADIADVADVQVIAQQARDGDDQAERTLLDAFTGLGEALAPVLERFGTTVLVVGGSMAGSWDIVEPALRVGLSRIRPAAASLPIVPAARPEDAALVGAAFWSVRHTG